MWISIVFLVLINLDGSRSLTSVVAANGFLSREDCQAFLTDPNLKINIPEEMFVDQTVEEILPVCISIDQIQDSI